MSKSEIDSLMNAVREARVGYRSDYDDLPDEAKTNEQLILAAEHGTPKEFALACVDALGTISVDEMTGVIQNYVAKWEAAG